MNSPKYDTCLWCGGGEVVRSGGKFGIRTTWWDCKSCRVTWRWLEDNLTYWVPEPENIFSEGKWYNVPDGCLLAGRPEE